MPLLPADNRILFYQRDRKDFGFLSNFHPSPIAIDGENWPTVEHFYQAQKSRERNYRQAIREAVSPGHAKRLGTSPAATGKDAEDSWFRRNGRDFRTDWDEVKLEVMRLALRAKFLQNQELATLLLQTGDAELVEDSSKDAFWGMGADQTGSNWLGRLLMDVRGELAAAGCMESS